MCGNSSVKKNYELKKLDALLYNATKIAGDELANELPEYEDVKFSEQHEEKMRHLFSEYRRKERCNTTARRIVACCAVFAAVACISVVSIKPWREGVATFFSERYAENPIKPNSAMEPAYSEPGIALYYIPTDFILTDRNQTENRTLLRFEKKNLYFELSAVQGETQLNINYKKSGAEKVRINDIDAFLFKKNHELILKWCNHNTVYTLTGNVKMQTFSKIAKNIN